MQSWFWLLPISASKPHAAMDSSVYFIMLSYAAMASSLNVFQSCNLFQPWDLADTERDIDQERGEGGEVVSRPCLAPLMEIKFVTRKFGRGYGSKV